MKAFLREISQTLIRQPMPVDGIFKTVTAIIIIRTVIEKILSTGHRMLYSNTDFYACAVGDLHMYFSWICIFLSMSVPVALFLGISYRDAMKVTLIGFCVTVFVPITDYIFTMGQGDAISYFRNFETFAYNYINLFNPFAAMKGVTSGVRLEVLTVFFGSFLIALLGFQRGAVRSLLLAFSLYTIVYLYGYLLPFHESIGINLPTLGRWSIAGINGAQLLFFAYLIPFTLSSAAVAAIIARENRANGRAIAALFYPSRLLFYLFLLCFGLLFTAWQGGNYPKIINKADILRLASAVLSISILFVWAKLMNDVNDIAIDRISNRGRPLVTGAVSEEDALRVSIPLTAISFVLAVPVGQDFFYFWLFIWGLSYVYSAPPFRFRRFWPLGHLILALIGIGVFLGGASIAASDNFYGVWKNKEIVPYVFMAFFLLCHVKDLKDVEGDRAGAVFNIFGHMPPAKARIVGLAFFCGFIFVILPITKILGILNMAVIAGSIVSIGAAAACAIRSKSLAGLDHLLTVAFLYLLYVSGVWIIFLGGSG